MPLALEWIGGKGNPASSGTRNHGASMKQMLIHDAIATEMVIPIIARRPTFTEATPYSLPTRHAMTAAVPAYLAAIRRASSVDSSRNTGELGHALCRCP